MAKKKRTTLDLYMTAVKKADRELSLGNGWVAKDRPHKSKKVYDRKKFKLEE